MSQNGNKCTRQPTPYQNTSPQIITKQSLDLVNPIICGAVARARPTLPSVFLLVLLAGICPPAKWRQQPGGGPKPGHTAALAKAAGPGFMSCLPENTPPTSAGGVRRRFFFLSLDFQRVLVSFEFRKAPSTDMAPSHAAWHGLLPLHVTEPKLPSTLGTPLADVRNICNHYPVVGTLFPHHSPRTGSQTS